PHRKSVLRTLFSRASSEPAPSLPENVLPVLVRGSLQLRHVDTGSCNGCEIEIASAFAPTYDASRYGVRLVASPRHADGLLVTGVVTKNMSEPLRRVLEATPSPRKVIACGDCAVNGGVFNDGHGVDAPLRSFTQIDVEITGCPPHPDAIVAALRRMTNR
ncbi:MAG TPA: NADH-quinone oxidoreductase subunit B family protein, partial [Acidimicrobiales bacterium]|nr:NADH-quinone oxidoreductase subunit B family protein [Acidimicrobiales bacterium]